MKVPFVDLKRQYQQIKPEIDLAISGVIENTSFIGGEPVKKFERAFEKLYGVKHCVSVANGTDAIYISLKMLGIGPGDEVITVANSWISSSEAISQTGATVVFADIDPDSYTISTKSILERLTPKTKAILPVHLFGQAAHISEIKVICDNHNLFLVEDCAQSHFTEENGQRVGTFGNAGTFSFYPGKNLGAYGDAGCIITNDDDLADKFRMYANHGALKKHYHIIEGINSRLDGLQAAILSVKLNYILEWTNERRVNASYYRSVLKDIEEIEMPKERDNTRHSYHLFVIRTKERDDLKLFLEKNGVQTAIHYPHILPNLEAYKRLKKQIFPVAQKYESEILSLPMYPELSREKINFIAATIKNFYEK